MGIINREGDITEKKEWVIWSNSFGQGTSNLVQQGQTFYLGGPMPYPGTLQSGKVFSQGCSGAMNLNLFLNRFIPGAGSTNIAVSISNMVCQEWGTSGALGFSGLPPQGSTLLTFQAGDIFGMRSSASNTAVQNLMLQLVMVKTQDIVSHNGIQ